MARLYDMRMPAQSAVATPGRVTGLGADSTVTGVSYALPLTLSLAAR
jgi:hypothetical protein